MHRGEHWDEVYRRRPTEELSWFQAEPTPSLDLIGATGVGHDARILDVGGGTSLLVDRLLDLGFRRPGVLDISGVALELARRRLADRSDAVTWLEADVLEYDPEEPWDVWHDRAVFHFLVDPIDRARYRASLLRSVRRGGHALVATFGPEGPVSCSGLATVRCSAEDLARELGSRFRLVESRTEHHRTPSGVVQQFVYARLERS